MDVLLTTVRQNSAHRLFSQLKPDNFENEENSLTFCRHKGKHTRIPTAAISKSANVYPVGL